MANYIGELDHKAKLAQTHMLDESGASNTSRVLYGVNLLLPQIQDLSKLDLFDSRGPVELIPISVLPRRAEPNKFLFSNN
jgi:hypothetical protein